jgi:CheY-like chemotaxis protein
MSSSSVSDQAPEPPEPPSPVAADGPRILVAIPDAELGKQCEDSLKQLGFRASGVADGVEAMLEIQRQLPAVVVLAASLPRMYGFQICEIVKRNESLQHIAVVLVGSVHHKDRYRRPPGELYGADEFLEEPDLPGALGDVVQRLSGVAPGGAPQADSIGARQPVAPPRDEAGDAPGIEPASTREPALGSEAVSAAAPTAAEAPKPPSADDGLDDQRATAERLARIIVSDIVLYNEEKFQAAIAAGNVQQAMSGDLDEGRGLFVERIDERVREERDYLGDELLRVARARGMS